MFHVIFLFYFPFGSIVLGEFRPLISRIGTHNTERYANIHALSRIRTQGTSRQAAVPFGGNWLDNVNRTVI
jgi:hypothetical protein